MREEEGVSVCVFPAEPERAVYNNALLARDLDPECSASAIDTMERLSTSGPSAISRC